MNADWLLATNPASYWLTRGVIPHWFLDLLQFRSHVASGATASPPQSTFSLLLLPLRAARSFLLVPQFVTLDI